MSNFYTTDRRKRHSPIPPPSPPPRPQPYYFLFSNRHGCKGNKNVQSFFQMPCKQRRFLCARRRTFWVRLKSRSSWQRQSVFPGEWCQSRRRFLWWGRPYSTLYQFAATLTTAVNGLLSPLISHRQRYALSPYKRGGLKPPAGFAYSGNGMTTLGESWALKEGSKTWTGLLSVQAGVLTKH